MASYVIKEKNPQSIVQLFLLDDTLTRPHSSLSHVVPMPTALIGFPCLPLLRQYPGRRTRCWSNVIHTCRIYVKNGTLTIMIQMQFRGCITCIR
ncbi:hypothetical protein KCU95_g121, partial [Aureobasidium melanogenum]